MTNSTLTIFRKFFNGEIIALFPELDENSPYYCMSYMHIGQHSGADYHGVIQITTKATPKEYESLKTELESIGYNLKIRQKWIRKRRLD